ncbi:tryptophan 7-halogenase [Parvularcula flava]|uniref:Tryptophan 7-halogenase n=1 Tax=Aquisalinus luteolus TaxID=1566827 RepID=A0A8J3A3R6_9PROT|nr:tryptophan halogenase family protein [Aquisalinus luteolus]NHK28917.1 tryptophan 7-halogenase [Aquisalinus luteolus]GGI00863.1 tryptophan halogenase [Aquisalinus luteolus]
MDKPIKRVVIIGGGTAGWLTAGILAADHCAWKQAGLDITLIESPDVPILGVGEGTWPSLRDTLRRIGIAETDFIRRCNASFKQGSRFDGWVDGSAGDSYFHPFTAPPDPDDISCLAVWRAAPEGTPFGEAISAQVSLCREGKAPKQAATPEYAAVANYAYHLDAGAFATLLREHCTARLGVTHIMANVTSVSSTENGHISSIQADGHGTVDGDLFIDCTGSRAMLIGEHFNSPLTDVSDILFNDRALALHVPYEDELSAIASQTVGTALSAGWVWDIGLQSRRGVGYVHSSNHISEDAACAGLDAYLEKTAPGSGVRSEDARLIRFRSAYRREPWRGNCVAVGMSSGFVEPLEASAIVMVELSADMISSLLSFGKGQMTRSAGQFNRRFAYRWARIVDFLKLHYILSQRTEPYWRDHLDRSTWPERLTELLERWRHGPPSRDDFPQIQEIFPAASYAYVMYGMGFETAAPQTLRRLDDPAIARRHLDDIRTMTRRFLAGLPTNRQLLDHVMQAGLTRV